MFAAAVLIVGVVLFVKFPPFRVFTLIAAGLAVVGIVVLFAQHEEGKQKREAAKHLVAPTSLEFQDLYLERQQYGGYRLTGRVKNNSPFTVTALTVQVSLSDCGYVTANKWANYIESQVPVDAAHSGGHHCDVVGDEPERFWVTIPPGQARDLNTFMNMDHAQVKNAWEWSYTVPEVSAKEPE